MSGSQIMSQIVLPRTAYSFSCFLILILSFVLITTTEVSTAVFLDPNALRQPAENHGTSDDDLMSHRPHRVKRQESSGRAKSDIWNTNTVDSFHSFDRRREQTQKEYDRSFAEHENQMKVVGRIFIFVVIFATIIISVLACVCAPKCCRAKKNASPDNGRGAVYSSATVVPPPTSGADPGNYPTQPYSTGIALPPPAGSYPMQPLMGGGGGFMPPNSYSPKPPSPNPPQQSPMQQQPAYNPYSPSQPVAPYPPSSGQGPPPYPVN